MPQSRSKYQFYQEASLSQKLSFKHPEFRDYAGSHTETSEALANLRIFAAFGLIDLDKGPAKLLYALLNEKRKAMFATSEKVNEISKMGMMMPKAEDEFYGTD